MEINDKAAQFTMESPCRIGIASEANDARYYN